jgi:hypothetical protein
MTVKERIIRSSFHSAGYLVCTVFPGKKSFIHRLVALAFIPNRKKNPCINHKNGDKADNRVLNLEWCTHKENNQHAVDVLKRRNRKGIKNGHGLGRMRDLFPGEASRFGKVVHVKQYWMR